MTDLEKDLHVTIGHLYPTIMSQYGDRGNLLCLLQCCAWRGIKTRVVELGLGELCREEIDLFLMGGGADSQQKLVVKDLVEVKGPGIKQAIDDGVPALLICAGYQLFGRYYRPYQGEDLPGLGILPAYTVHRAAQIGATLTNLTDAAQVRLVGNTIVEWNGQICVGFENHGGRTYLDSEAGPLGKVLLGGGNNGEDGLEGCVYKNAVGTYLHGPVLPKNPHLADHLIALALRRRYGPVHLEPLDDALEQQTREEALARAMDRQGNRTVKSSLRQTPAIRLSKPGRGLPFGRLIRSV